MALALEQNRIPEEVLAAPAGKRIHLVAIGGVAMAGLATMLRALGADVTGSDDQLYPPVSDLLAELGISVLRGFHRKNLEPRPDLVIVGNKVTRNNPEAQALGELGVPFASLPQAIRALCLEGKHRCVVAGTHGKTTSTAMLAWVMEQEGWAPGFLIGGRPENFSSSARIARGPFFVIEGDEYDSAFFDKRPKFLHYQPDSLLLTAIEFDHADVYRDLEHVKQAFRELIGLLPSDANFAVCADFPHALEVAQTHPRPVLFGTSEEAEWRIAGFREEGERSNCAVLRHGKVVARMRLRLPGVMNARNGLGVLALVERLGVPPERAAAALEEFRGVARRQQVVGEFHRVLLIDDFAHHPTAVRATLEALRQRYPERRLWAVFEPRSNTSRRRVFQKEYVQAFTPADRVIVGGVLKKPSDALNEQEMFSPEELVTDLKHMGIPARFFPDTDTIAVALWRNTRPGDVVVLLSNGDFGGLRTKLVALLDRNQREAT